MYVWEAKKSEFLVHLSHFSKFLKYLDYFEIQYKWTKKLWFLCFRGIQNSLPSFWAKLGYFWIKIDRIADCLLKLQIRIGVHLINVELLQLLTPAAALPTPLCIAPPFSAKWWSDLIRSNDVILASDKTIVLHTG